MRQKQFNNSRVYFKNDLLFFAQQKEKKEQKSKKEAKDPKKEEKSENQKQIEQVDPSLCQKEAQKAFELNFSQKQKQQRAAHDQFRDIVERGKKEEKNIGTSQRKSVLFLPKSTYKSQVKVEEKKMDYKEKEKEERKDRKQMWKMKQDLKKTLKVQDVNKEKYKVEENEEEIEKEQTQKKEIEKKQKQEKGKGKNKKVEKDESKNKEKEESSSSSDDAKKGKKKGTKKKKIIKKQQNHVKINLKKKYQDKFVGGLNRNLQNLAKKRKQKFGYKTNTELEITEGEMYNSFIISLSKALFFTIDLEEEDEVKDEQLNYTIPSEINRESLSKLIFEIFKFQSFREGQYETIENILNGKSTLFVSETASGKSLTYLLPSIILKGLSIVVSPLVSLMLDQLEHLPSDLPAACISSLLNRENKDKILEMVKSGKIQLLFLTPQILLTDFMYHFSEFPPINFVCIDEAHSLSELSHSFRVSYLSLVEIVMKYFNYKSGSPVVLCLTATANEETSRSIMQKMQITEKIRSKTIINKNLFITISKEKDMSKKFDALLTYIKHPQIMKCRGILIYCRTKYLVNTVNNFLTNSSINCFSFHSDLTQKQKTDILSNFRNGAIRIVISTIALGMGLDFQNLECVIHFNLPKSVQNYIQEIGRAGRRNKRAYCHLFLDSNDYFVERNYFLEDELEVSILNKLVEKMKNSKTKINIENKTESEMKRLCIKDEENEQEQDIFEQKEQKEEKQEQKNKLLSSCKSSIMSEASGLKEGAILKVLLKIERVLGKQTFKVMPLSHQTLKIGFFKNNIEQIKEKSQFFKHLIEDCKVIKGTIYVPLIKKCNYFMITPIQLLSRIYGIANKNFLKIQLINEVFVWQHQISPKYTFEKIKKSAIFSQIIEEVNQLQTTSLTKFNIFYSLCFNEADANLSLITQNNKIIKESDPLPSNSIMKKFDQYFLQSTHSFYHDIAKQGSLNSQNAIESSYLPISEISQSDKIQIYNHILLFLKHMISSSSEKDLKKVLALYKDGRIITKVLLGVNDTNSSWKQFRDHPYWSKFKTKNHKQLLIEVKNGVRKFVEEEAINYVDIKNLKK